MDHINQYIGNGRDRVNELATVFAVFAGIAIFVLAIVLGLENVWLNLGFESKAIVKVSTIATDPLLLLVAMTVWLSMLLVYIWVPLFAPLVQTVGLQVESALYLFLGAGFGSGLLLAVMSHRADILMSVLSVLLVSVVISVVMRIRALETDMRESTVLRVVMSFGVLLMIGLTVFLTANAVG